MAERFEGAEGQRLQRVGDVGRMAHPSDGKDARFLLGHRHHGDVEADHHPTLGRRGAALAGSHR